MEKVNYNLKHKEELKKLEGQRPTLLLHACCGPCSTNIITTLYDKFEITVFYSNSNIYPESEYLRRRDELIDFIEEFNQTHNSSIKVIEDKYEPEIYLCQLGTYGAVREGGKRCYLCYQLRLEKSAKYAALNGFEYYTTTLSVSPHKNSQWINQIGAMMAKKETKWLYSDFKKENGYQKSCAIADSYDMYRQNYCGCLYSYEQMKLYLEQRNQD